MMISDVREKRFHGLKNVWGVPKFMTLESFSDAANGFLVENCCVFGAEVFIKDGQIKRSIVSTVKPECDMSYTWRIQNFSDLNSPTDSPVFSFGEWSWYVNTFSYRYICLFLLLLYVTYHNIIENDLNCITMT